MGFSAAIRRDTRTGLGMLPEVDLDICRRINDLAADPGIMEQAVEAVCGAISERRKIYVYGCGATGRLAKQAESAFWRPFWKKLKASALWGKLAGQFPADIPDLLIGEMTGGDRALVSSLEGFEDLELIGRLQLADRGIRRGDVVIAVTEGGETSSVIGTILAAASQYGQPDEATMNEARRNLYYFYNNPDDLLLAFDRSRSVLMNSGITKLNLTTGPQALAGSTRMQATTIGTFVLGAIIEEALSRCLKEFLSQEEMAGIGLKMDLTLRERLLSFIPVRESVDRTLEPLTRLTDLEAATYRAGHFSTYFAGRALTTVFTDSTERSPTFRLTPLDPVTGPVRKSWIQVWTGAASGKDAWNTLLGRDFRGMDESFYRPAFEKEIGDAWLKEAALRSLSRAGTGQSQLYDLSFSAFNRDKRSPGPGDLCLAVCLDDETGQLSRPESAFSRFLGFAREKGAVTVILCVRDASMPVRQAPSNADLLIELIVNDLQDPIGFRQQVALKMLLNAHSTAVMALLGRVTGNTMTSVSPGNLKLTGRATHLIREHVNEALGRAGLIENEAAAGALTYAEANAVLFDCMEFYSGNENGQCAEVALCIVRILEAFRDNGFVSWKEADALLNRAGLEGYLAGF